MMAAARSGDAGDGEAEGDGDGDGEADNEAFQDDINSEEVHQVHS
jgi:hypothetical protein